MSSYVTLGQEGLAAAEAKDWGVAITKLSKALQSSLNPAWLLARSKSFINLQKYNEALSDANMAWHAAFERSRRPLMIEANYRRAVAYFRMGQFANSDACCIYAIRLVKNGPAVDKNDPVAHLKDPATGRWTATVEDAMKEAQTDNKSNNNNLSNATMAISDPSNVLNSQQWRMANTLRIQALSAMAKLPADAAARTATAQAKPEKEKLAPVVDDAEETERATLSSTASTKLPTKLQVPSDTPLRLQDFQSNTNMSVSIFSKGVIKEKLKVEFQPYSVHLDALIYPSGEERPFQLDLWGEIDTTASKYTVTPNKVELNLVKKTPGKWGKLTSDGKPRAPAEPAAAPVTLTGEKPAAETPAVVEAASTTGPAYPSSSRTGPKNWDKLDLGEDGKEDEGSDDVNGFFKQLFKNASPDAQRAMMKSFTESNGTSLSTNWDEVKNETVKMVPPDGVVPKKWE